MIRLALDTSVLPSSLAIQKNNDAIIAKTLPPQKAGAEYLVCEVKSLMAEAKIGFADLDQIITTRGPGPFIGLRIGLAAARAFALAAALPVRSISTFAVFASFVEGAAGETILVYRPARKGFLVFQSFCHQWQPTSPLQVLGDQAFALYQQQQKNTLYAPKTPPQKIAAQLLLLPANLMEDGAQPLYPPVCS